MASIFANATSVLSVAAEEISLDDHLEKELANEVELWRMETTTSVHSPDMGYCTVFAPVDRHGEDLMYEHYRRERCRGASSSGGHSISAISASGGTSSMSRDRNQELYYESSETQDYRQLGPPYENCVEEGIKPEETPDREALRVAVVNTLGGPYLAGSPGGAEASIAPPADATPAAGSLNTTDGADVAEGAVAGVSTPVGKAACLSTPIHSLADLDGADHPGNHGTGDQHDPDDSISGTSSSDTFPGFLEDDFEHKGQEIALNAYYRAGWGRAGGVERNPAGQPMQLDFMVVESINRVRPDRSADH